MTVSAKIKTINNKTEQNKAQYNLDRQTTNTSALSSGNIDKDEILTAEDILPEKKNCYKKDNLGFFKIHFGLFSSVFDHFFK